MRFQLVILAIVVCNIAWWGWAHWRLRSLRRRRTWRLALAAFMLFQLGGFCWVMASRLLRYQVELPTPLLVGVYLWNLIIMPAAIVMTLLSGVIGGVIRGVRALLGYLCGASHTPPAQGATGESPASATAARSEGMTRRQVLAAAAVAVPPLLTGGSVVGSLVQLQNFRVRSITVPIAGLPAELDGLTIAHLSDPHIGRLTNASKLRAIVDRTNALGADLVLMTGDLIDFSLSALPDGLEMLHGITSKYGLYICEGNHDLFEDWRQFEGAVLDSGLKLLLNDSEFINIRGQVVQVLGIRWGSMLPPGNDVPPEGVKLRTPWPIRSGAFPIVLAHHPHVFDTARSVGVPLTLSGHTHGGQLMLTPNIGAGPLMFRYWSGLYQRGDSSLVVSNGVGNWFPLRINAPAEIIHLTLRPA